MSKLENLQQKLVAIFADKISLEIIHEQIIATVKVEDLTTVMKELRDNADLHFEQCVDIAGMDYSTYKDDYSGLRFAAVYQLLSIKYNWRIRVKCFALDDSFPVLPSVIDIWNSVNWCEREAFDLFGIIFDGHPDLRRILTDYGFIGHPFRKDFPISGYMEMKYDEAQGRVVYTPVTIEPREITPRIIREENYGG